MRITATYKTAVQCSPEDYETVTKVIYLEPDDTLKQAYEKITVGWKEKAKVDVEIHFEQT